MKNLQFSWETRRYRRPNRNELLRLARRAADLAGLTDEFDWDLGIPFNEKAGRYTGLGNGEYYYSAGAIRPVDASTAYVMGSILCLPPSALSGKDAAKIREMPALEDASVRFNGPVGYLKLKKGFFGWYVERDSIAPLAKPSGEKTGNGKQKN